MKKIIFLDIDGVLVTDRCQMQLWETNGTLRDEHGALFDSECVKSLKEISSVKSSCRTFLRLMSGQVLTRTP